MTCRFGIVPDGAEEPAAVFQDLEDAMMWGLEKFGPEKFCIRQCTMAQVSADDGLDEGNEDETDLLQAVN